MYLSSTHSSYTARKLLDGLDGRAVYYAYVSETDELRYDNADYTAGGTALMGIAAVSWEHVPLGGGAVVDDGEDPTVSVTSRAVRRAHLRSTTDSVDNVGNVLQQTAHGRIEGEDGETPSEAIVSHTTPTLCNAAGWIWRTDSAYIDGDGVGMGVRYGDTDNSYDATTCDLLLSTQHVALESGTTDYAFDGDTDGAASYGLASS